MAATKILNPIKHRLDGDIDLPAEGTSKSIIDGADENRDGLYFEWIKGKQDITWKPLDAFIGKNKRLCARI